MLTAVNFPLAAVSCEGRRGAGAPLSAHLAVLLSSAELSVLPLQGEGIISVVTKMFCQCTSKLSYGDLYSKIFHFMQSMFKN